MLEQVPGSLSLVGKKKQLYYNCTIQLVFQNLITIVNALYGKSSLSPHFYLTMLYYIIIWNRYMRGTKGLQYYDIFDISTPKQQS